MGALLAPLAIFSGPYAVLAKWAVIGLLVAAVFVFGWVKGNGHGTQKLIDYQGKQSVEATRLVKARELVTIKVVDRYIQVKGATRTVTETVEKEVVKYAESNSGLCLDTGWRVRHDAAALNTLPAAGFRIDGALRAPAGASGERSTESRGGAGNGNVKLQQASSLR